MYDLTDEEALHAFHVLSEKEGIIPALESAHAVAWVLKHAAGLENKIVVINLSGRGDKDVEAVAKREMLNLGFSPENLVVTGNPFFDDLEPRSKAFTQEDQQRIRDKVGKRNR